MLSHSRNLFSPKQLETRRHRRAFRRRIIPAWRRRHSCTCGGCVPWYVPDDVLVPSPFDWREDLLHAEFIPRSPDEIDLAPWGFQSFRLRLHARWIMTELARFQPRLGGVLGELDRARFPFFEGIELAADEGDLPAVAAHLASLGFRVEHVRHGDRPALEAELHERIVVIADDALRPGITLSELESGLARLHGKRFAERFGRRFAEALDVTTDFDVTERPWARDLRARRFRAVSA